MTPPDRAAPRAEPLMPDAAAIEAAGRCCEDIESAVRAAYAADAGLAALVQRVRSLEEQLRATNRSVETGLNVIAEWQAERDRLAAQVVKLREALQDVLAETDLVVIDEIVRAALRASEPTPP